jgi:hypothetical protein
MNLGTRITVTACHVVLRPQVALQFSSLAGNDWRGALGTVLPFEFFRPAWPDGPSGWRNAPSPFVLRTHELDGRRIEAGEEFELAFHLFDQHAWDPLHEAIVALGRTGVARHADDPERRVPFDVGEVRRESVLLPFDITDESVSGVSLEFVTPTELKGQTRGEAPLFSVLVDRLRDRFLAIASFYDEYLPEGRALGTGAADVRIEHAVGGWVDGERRSTRTGQQHPLSGWRGQVRYSGECGPFLTLLRAGWWLGAGRHTVWGFGCFRIKSEDADQVGSSEARG